VRVEIVRRLPDPSRSSWFGTIETTGYCALSCEREWLGNQRGRSCLPGGPPSAPAFYALEPHDGPKYQGTFALIGSTVSHSEMDGLDRFACVIHAARYGLELAGCTAAGYKLAKLTSGLVLEESSEATTQLLRLLAATSGPHYLTISEETPWPTGTAS
jgi:hypothetical protein